MAAAEGAVVGGDARRRRRGRGRRAVANAAAAARAPAAPAPLRDAPPELLLMPLLQLLPRMTVAGLAIWISQCC